MTTDQRAFPEPSAAHAGAHRHLLLALSLLASGIFATVLGMHADNNDAALYALIARRMAEHGDLLRPSYPLAEFSYAPFREHPPLFFWLQSLVVGPFPNLGLRVLGAACGLGTVIATYVAGRELVGRSAAFLGALVLVVSPWFFEYQPLPRLDPPLTFAFTASVALLVIARGRPSFLLMGGLIAGLGALVKGPPALGAPVAAALALVAAGRAEDLRRVRTFVLVGTMALLPPALFLAFDHVAFGSEWWHGYIDQQFIASVTGARRDQRTPAYLFGVVTGRFWPGLPLTVFALVSPWVARNGPGSRERLRTRVGIVLWAALVVGGYSLASRFYWWYVMPAFPPLALLAGAGLGDIVSRWRGHETLRHVRNVAFGVGVALVLLSPLRVARAWGDRCAFGDLPVRACELAGRAPVAIVKADYTARVVFGEHARCETMSVSDVETAARAALVTVVRSEGAPADGDRRWKRIARHGEWVLVAPRE